MDTEWYYCDDCEEYESGGGHCCGRGFSPASDDDSTPECPCCGGTNVQV